MKFQLHLNAINRYMRDKNINQELQLRIGAYLEYHWSKRSREKELEESVIKSLAPSLREQLIVEANGFFFQSIPWMQ